MTHSDDITESPRRHGRMLQAVTYPRPRCPRCGNGRLRKYRSITDQGDGTALAWVECRSDQCRYRFRLVLQ